MEIDFHDVVDEDPDQAYEDYVSDVLVGQLVQSSAMRMFILCCILINTVIIGVQTNFEIVSLADTDHPFIGSNLFLAEFALYPLLRCYQLRPVDGILPGNNAEVVPWLLGILAHRVECV